MDGSPHAVDREISSVWAYSEEKGRGDFLEKQYGSSGTTRSRLQGRVNLSRFGGEKKEGEKRSQNGTKREREKRKE